MEMEKKYLKLNDFLLESASLNINENEHADTPTNENNVKTFEAKFKSLNKSQVRLSVDEMISQNKFLNESNIILIFSLSFFVSKNKIPVFEIFPLLFLKS